MSTPRKPNAPSKAGVEQDIERTRKHLGDTVHALADKADVPARVKEKVHATTEAVHAQADEMKQKVSHQMHEGAQVLAAKAEDVADQAKTLTNQAMEQLPPPVRERVEQVATKARQQPMQFAVGAVVAFLLLRWVLRGRR
jgi:methyl-accepting chemotaxis protein